MLFVFLIFFQRIIFNKIIFLIFYNREGKTLDEEETKIICEVLPTLENL